MMHKYPRTRHVKGSRMQRDDLDLEAVDFSGLAGRHLVVEEKMDGANCGVSFDSQGRLQLQSRGHYLQGGPRERQFDLLKQWAASRQHELRRVLGDRYVMYGEWLFAKHTYFYDALPHYFMEFDVLDTKTGDFLSTPRRRELLRGAPVTSVLVLHEGAVAGLDALRAMVTRSYFITDRRKASWYDSIVAAGIMQPQQPVWAEQYLELERQCDWSPDMEGLYLKWEEAGVVKGRYKFVRESFTNSILGQEEHWHDRPIVQNRLVPGALERMFS